MENYSTNILSKSAKLRAVKEFLRLLDYEQYDEKTLLFYFFKHDNYKYHTGVELEIYRGFQCLEINSWVYPESNSFDLDYQILTVRQLKAHFGGDFKSEAGSNRFPHISIPTRIGAESGCFLAFSRFQTNVGRIKVFLSTRGITNYPPPEIDLQSRDRHPVILSNNLIVPFLVSTMEDFFRSSYIALLQYSEVKRNIFSKARLTSEDLVDIASESIIVENAFARHLSFQNIDRICDHFKDLNKSIDLKKVLDKRFKKSNLSILVALRDLVTRRNALIHQTQLDSDYLDKIVQKDIRCIEQAVTAVYNLFLDSFNWQPLEV